jgi:hypothetical protein
MTRKIFKVLVTTVSPLAVPFWNWPEHGVHGHGAWCAAVAVVAATSEVTERILVARILAVRVSGARMGRSRFSAARHQWPISAACRARAATSLTLTPRIFTD